MPNMDSLIHTIFQTQPNAPQDISYLTMLDLLYSYSQLTLHADTTHQCNFNLVSGDTTATYGFKTGFYFLSDMQADFQKALDCKLTSLINTFCFLESILIVSRGHIEDHLYRVRKCLIKLEDENLINSLGKCHFLKT